MISRSLKFLSLIAIAIATCFMIGCASFDANVDTNKMLVMAGTMKAIERGETADERSYRAKSAIEFVDRTRTWLDFERLTVAQLKIKLDAEVQSTNWAPSDKMIAFEIINQVTRKLSERVIDGVALPVPPEEAIYQVNTVLDWIESAARLY